MRETWETWPNHLITVGLRLAYEIESCFVDNVFAISHCLLRQYEQRIFLARVTMGRLLSVWFPITSKLNAFQVPNKDSVSVKRIKVLGESQKQVCIFI